MSRSEASASDMSAAPRPPVTPPLHQPPKPGNPEPLQQPEDPERRGGTHQSPPATPPDEQEHPAQTD